MISFPHPTPMWGWLGFEPMMCSAITAASYKAILPAAGNLVGCGPSLSSQSHPIISYRPSPSLFEIHIYNCNFFPSFRRGKRKGGVNGSAPFACFLGNGNKYVKAVLRVCVRGRERSFNSIQLYAARMGSQICGVQPLCWGSSGPFA